MSLNGWKRTDYDERFEMLNAGRPRQFSVKLEDACHCGTSDVGVPADNIRYSPVIKQNSSWSQAATSLSGSVRRRQSDRGLSSSRGFPAPAPERSGGCGQSREAKPSRAQSEASLQKRTSQSRPWAWPDRDPGRNGRAGGDPQRRSRRRGERGWASAGSENSIAITSEEGTDWEASEEGIGAGRMTSSPIEVADAGADALWFLEDDDGLQDREREARSHDRVVSLPDVEREVLGFGGAVEDEDQGSLSLSTSSGPTLSAHLTLQSPCPTCAKLFRNMGKLKHWEKSIEKDPTSLSCDQWVLKKIWRPRRLPSRKGKLWSHLPRIRKRASSSTEAGETQQPKTSCSRPHVFLHRNLSLCKRKEALAHLRPCHRRTKVDSRRRVDQVGARKSRRQKKRKLCEMEPRWEEPLEEGPLEEEEGVLNISDSSEGEGKNRACRKLFGTMFVSPDPHRQKLFSAMSVSPDPHRQKLFSTMSVSPDPRRQKLFSVMSVSPDPHRQKLFSVKSVSPDPHRQKLFSAMSVSPDAHRQKLSVSPDAHRQKRFSAMAVSPDAHRQKRFSAMAVSPDAHRQKLFSTMSVSPDPHRQKLFSVMSVSPDAHRQKLFSAMAVSPDAHKQKLFSVMSVSPDAHRQKRFSVMSVSPDAHRQSEEPRFQKTIQRDIETDASCTSLASAARRRSKTFKASAERGALGACPWVRDGGFKSMLAELEEKRNLVVRELDRLTED